MPPPAYSAADPERHAQLGQILPNPAIEPVWAGVPAGHGRMRARVAERTVLRRVFIAVVVVLLLVALAWFGVTRWLASDDPRARLQAALSDALQRDVTIGGLVVEGEHVVLTGVAIGNPEGFDGAPLLRAERIELDVALEDLLDDELTGVVRANAIDLRIVKHNGTTSLLGPLRPRSPGGRALDMHVDLAITSSRLLLEDLDRGQSLALEGVGMRVLLSNRDGAREGQASVTIAEVGLHGIPLRDVRLRAQANDETVELSELQGTLGRAGRVHGTGRMWIGGERGWTFDIVAEDVDLDGDVRPLVAVLYPPLTTTANLVATAATGKLAARVQLGGTGLHWEQVRPTLAGTGTVTLMDVELPPDSMLLDLAALAGRPPGPWTLARIAVEVTLADAWLSLGRVTTDDALAIPLEGRVSLAGELDLRVDLMPLVRAFGGGVYKEVARVATSLPVRIGGTVQAPEIAPPTASDVGRSLLGGAMRRALE